MNVKELRRIKSLCNLGIHGRTLIPILLPEIRKIVPSYSSTFLWLDKTCRFINVYDESPDSPSVISNFVNNYLGNRDLLARRSLSEWLRKSATPVTISSTEQLAFRGFYHSDYYREILKPLRYHHSLYAGIKTGTNPVGILVLHRQPGERSFSQHDKNNLRELTPLITPALREKELSPHTLPSQSEIGLCLIDEQGHLQHINPQARKLMLLATHPEVKKGIAFPLYDSAMIPDGIISMAQKLRKQFHDDNKASFQPLKWEVNNPWGSFSFQASWLQTPRNGDKGLIAVNAQYCEPSLYRVVLECDALGFTTRQTEVTTSMLKGLSNHSIAKEISVSDHTVKDHIKNIYNRLGINNRCELLPSLISIGGGGRPSTNFSDVYPDTSLIKCTPFYA